MVGAERLGCQCGFGKDGFKKRRINAASDCGHDGEAAAKQGENKSQ